jgi:hypothetical protein
MWARYTHKNQVTDPDRSIRGFNSLSQNDFGQFTTLGVHALNDPGFEIARLYQGDLGWKTHYKDLAHFDDRASK